MRHVFAGRSASILYPVDGAIVVGETNEVASVIPSRGHKGELVVPCLDNEDLNRSGRGGRATVAGIVDLLAERVVITGASALT